MQVSKEVHVSAPQLVGECSHSKLLPYGAFAMLVLYWTAKYPPVQAALPHLIGTTNTVAGMLSVVIGRQSARQAKAKVATWWSHHVDFYGGVTVQLGKRGKNGRREFS